MKQLRDISAFLIQTHGIDISTYEDSFLKKTLQNHHSEFFRNALTFAVLERMVLPSLFLNKNNTRQKEIRIWSAACAQGQEVYSMAMLLEELRNRDKDKLKYRIFATDKCDAQISKARIGKYQSAALNNKKHSSPSAGIFGDFDIIICANLLLYFNPKKQKQILDKISKSVSDGAYLITGEAEREIVSKCNFTEVFPQSGIFQKKMERG